MRDKVEYHIEDTCSECGGHISIDLARGERVCDRCGLVADDFIVDQGPEYRLFDGDTVSKEHYGDRPNVMLHDKGLSTEIAYGCRDANGRKLDHRTMSVIYRLRKVQHQTRMNHALDRSIANASNIMTSIAHCLGVPKQYSEQAIMLYRKAVRENLIRGRSITGVVAACMYAVCRKLGTPRTLDEVAAAANIGRKEVGRTYRFIAAKLHLNIYPARPEEYIVRFSCDLGISQDTQRYAVDLLKRCGELDLMTGRGPIGVAASAIYIASVVMRDGGRFAGDDHITQKRISETTGITEVTIRNRYKEMVMELNIIEFKETYHR